MNWFFIAFLAVAGFLLIRYGKSLLGAIGKLLKDNVAALATVLVVFIVAILVVVMFQPQVLIGSSGIFGSNLKGSRAEANLKAAILDPTDNPAVWKNQTAQAAAEAVASEYQLEVARNKAGISAAEAERLCRLPKGDPQRALWDKAGVDPCTASLPAGLQGSVREVVKTTGEVASGIDLNATEASLTEPLGTAPTGSEQWIRSLYDLPKGLVLSVVLILVILVAGVAFSKVARSVLRS